MLEYDRSKRKWILYTRDGSRILGTHKTKKDALRQERAILWSQSKRKKGRSNGGLFNIFHCSPEKITKIKKYTNEFEGTLFFASEPYSLGACNYVYKLRVSDSDFVSVGDLSPTDEEIQLLTERMEAYIGITPTYDRALEFASTDDVTRDFTDMYTEEELYDKFGSGGYGALGDLGWWLQGFQARVARRMGFLGAVGEDEQGTVWMIDMVGRENLLTDFKEQDDEDFDEWERENPLPEVRFSENGYLINPKDGSEIWWHGDVAGSLYNTEGFDTPKDSKERIEDTHAAFFTSDERAAQFFALRGFSDRDGMFEEYTNVDPTVWSVRIKARNLYFPTDPNPNFSNFESPEFVSRLKREGYAGWWEQDTKSLQGIWNVALLHPESDVEVVNGYECLWRTNPYPHFMDCTEALTALRAIFSDDVEDQKRLTIEHVNSLKSGLYGRLYDDETLERITLGVRKAKTLDGILKVLSRNANVPDLQDIIFPAVFLMENVELVTEVDFIHWTYYTSEIAEEGIRGRATPHKQTMTRQIEDFQILGNGYIFAYPADQLDASTIVGGSGGKGYIRGYATHAVGFNFIPDDGEYQLLIPVKCIETYQEYAGHEDDDLSDYL